MENSYLQDIYAEEQQQQLLLLHEQQQQQQQQYEGMIRVPTSSTISDNTTIDLTVFMKDIGDRIDNGIQQLLSYHWIVSTFLLLSVGCIVLLFIYNIPLRFAINMKYHTIPSSTVYDDDEDNDEDDDDEWNALEQSLLLEHYQQHHRMNFANEKDNGDEVDNDCCYDPYSCAAIVQVQCCCYDDEDDDPIPVNRRYNEAPNNKDTDKEHDDPNSDFVCINIEAKAITTTTSSMFDNDTKNKEDDDVSYHYRLLDERI